MGEKDDSRKEATVAGRGSEREEMTAADGRQDRVIGTNGVEDAKQEVEGGTAQREGGDRKNYVNSQDLPGGRKNGTETMRDKSAKSERLNVEAGGKKKASDKTVGEKVKEKQKISPKQETKNQDKVFKDRKEKNSTSLIDSLDKTDADKEKTKVTSAEVDQSRNEAAQEVVESSELKFQEVNDEVTNNTDNI